MMHGKSRQKVELPLEEKQKQEEQAKRIQQQTEHFLQVRRGVVPPPEDLLSYTELVSQLCPEFASTYNYRREILKNKFDTYSQQLKDSENVQQTQETIEKFQPVISKEFDLINKQLKRYPKSYTLWTHRQWLVIESETLDKHIEDISKKLSNSFPKYQAATKDFLLCDKMLSHDERNFHVWNYRHWLVTISKIDNDEQFTLKKIEQNFSNFSAYHFRSKCYLRKYNTNQAIKERIDTANPIAMAPIPIEVLNQNIDLIQQAIYIQPKEHGVYLYHKWLLGAIQPFGVLGVRQGKDIKHISQQIQDNDLLIIFNRRVSYVGNSLKVLNNIDTELKCGEEYIIESLNNQDYSNFYLLRLKQQITKYKIILVSGIDDDKQSIQEENFNSKFFIGTEITIEDESNQFPFNFIIDVQINLKDEQKKDIDIVYQILEENIQFIQGVCEEEQGNRFSLLQLTYLMNHQFDLKMIRKQYKDAKNLLQRQILTYNQLDKQIQEQIQIQSNIQLINHKIDILNVLNGEQQNISFSQEGVRYDQNSIESFRYLIM